MSSDDNTQPNAEETTNDEPQPNAEDAPVAGETVEEAKFRKNRERGLRAAATRKANEEKRLRELAAQSEAADVSDDEVETPFAPEISDKARDAKPEPDPRAELRKPGKIVPGQPLTVEPVEVGDHDEHLPYWVGLRPECPIHNTTIAGVGLSKMMQHPAPGMSPFSVTYKNQGENRPGDVVMLTEEEVIAFLTIAARKGIEVETRNGRVVRASVQEAYIPADPKRGRKAVTRRGLVPLSNFVYIQPLEMDDEGNPIHEVHNKTPVPEPMHKG